ncbi:uncharacterized protein [Amphiura filiformis]|uniref:uncharacterized protein n=1 Tax=Amphiura filiformis TaxID=82378 RepID=UPI003B213909
MEASTVTVLSVLLSIIQCVRTDLQWISDCDRTKGCFRYPPDCARFPDINSLQYDANACEFTITWQQTFDTKSVNFEVYAPATMDDSEYIAIAFSHDQNMAGSDVYACISSMGNTNMDNNKAQVTLSHSYNTVSHINEAKELIGVSRLSGSNSNGIINCNFTRIKHIDGQKFFHNLNNQFYMLASRGRALEGNVAYHTIGRWRSSDEKENKYDFSKFTADPEPTTQSLTSDLGYKTGQSGGLLGGHCSSSPCQNSGTCTHTKTGFKCVCEYDYIGDRCQQKSAGSAVVYSHRILLLAILVTLVVHSLCL